MIFLFIATAFSKNGNSQVTNPMDSGAYFKSFDSTKIYYEVRGNGDAVVLVHGFIVNGQSWKRTELYKNLL